ncbi:MAG: hypothetical protein ACRDCE_00055 [Cetobacterium sp.]|uniref:hypothetical protein n=1 Tax=Cetobacterium sp. TaxID=2071632 RepID=UPI003EE6841C
MKRGRWFKKREETLKGTPYDSIFEKQMHETVLADCRFHLKEDKVEYSVVHTYEPDFVYEKDGKIFLIETKGRFRDSAEASKYIWIRKVLPENTELIFIWERPGTAFPFSKRRKDGTRATHKEWADKNGFRNWDRTCFQLDLL